MTDDPFADAPATAPTEDPWATGTTTATKAKAAAPAPADDPFGEPDAPTGGEARPAQKQLKDRYLVIRPLRLDLKVASSQPGIAPRDRLTADVLVCSGDPITHKIDKDGDRVAELDPPVGPGTMLPEFYLGGDVLIRQLKAKIGGKPVIGILRYEAKNAGGNKAYTFEEVPAGHAARAAAGKMWFEAEARRAEAAFDDPFKG